MHEHEYKPEWWAYAIYGVIAALTIFVLGTLAASKKERIPGRLQNFFEWSLDGLRTLYASILGDQVDKHLPFILTLFFYILFCNLIGLIPAFRSPTSALGTTFALALIVFFYVQASGIRAKGVLGYLRHFLGPVLFLFPLFIIIEVVGELAKPVSLSMRLYGNIYGEDVIMELVTKASANPVTRFIPFQFPVYLLQVFTDVLQAFIFTLLSSAYISIMTASHDHDDDHGHSHNSSEHTLEHVSETTALAGQTH